MLYWLTGIISRRLSPAKDASEDPYFRIPSLRFAVLRSPE